MKLYSEVIDVNLQSSNDIQSIKQSFAHQNTNLETATQTQFLLISAANCSNEI